MEAVILGIFAGVGGLLLLAGLLMRGPTAPAADVTVARVSALRAGEYVTLEGTVAPLSGGQALTAPIGDEPALHYEFTLRTYRTVFDGMGGKATTGDNRATVRERKAIIVELDDGSGRCLVPLDQAVFSLRKGRMRSGEATEQLAPLLMKRFKVNLAAVSSAEEGAESVWSQTVLAPGERVRVSGTVSGTDGSYALEKTKEKPLAVADLAADAGGSGRGRPALAIAGAVLLVVAVIGFVVRALQ